MIKNTVAFLTLLILVAGCQNVNIAIEGDLDSGVDTDTDIEETRDEVLPNYEDIPVFQ